jgi:hypothetical protein
MPGILEQHLPPLTEKLGVELDNAKVLSLCRYIEAEPRIWTWLGDSGRTRILAKIDSAPLAELESALRARHNLEIGERILARLRKEDAIIREKVIAKYPCKAFVPEALSLYAASASFATANERGAELLIPHAQFFSKEDVNTLNKAIRDNKWQQILNASATGSVLLQCFKLTQHLLPASAADWATIAEYIADKNKTTEYEYPEFLSDMKKAGIIMPGVGEISQASEPDF